ncbi:hypothetical protein Cme02nite_65490 [Catellatospora methionotrophica]|uniref:Uncharacterized protein n=1 Tax=Catellatospora methionotrophica TaxID=121620 RepID=A0A8J3LF77_9ACTN|nr:LamG-like jellyroll fold domain-containing protein [Catellatospora methionotrophica]GIG18217.1 hypothetical protein Cme02nite_65490 [Catellatospora methionotrophica]
MTTETTRVWANPSGTQTAQIHGVPTRLKRDGTWLDYDLTLVKRADGAIVPKVHPADLVIAGAAGAGDHDLAMVTAKGERIGLGWRGSLPEPVLDGPKATYPEVRPGVDLVIEASAVGFEQFLVLKDRAAATRVAGLSLPLRSASTTYAADADGSGRFTARDGAVVARVPVPLMWDGSGLNMQGEPRRKKTVRLDLTKSGSAKAKASGADTAPAGTELAFAPDQAWLADPATRYPVTVDPGISTNLGTGFDEFVQNTINISDNSGSDELKLGWSNDGGQFYARSYLRFDGLAGYKGATIYKADLNLWETWSWSCRDYGWRATRTDNVGPSVQWGNEPTWREDGPVSTETTGYSSSCADGWVKTDVRTILDDSFAAGWNSASMVIKASTDTSPTSWNVNSTDSWKKFSSNETTKKPYISLEYNHLPTVSQVKANKDATCGSGAGMRLYLNDSTPEFEAYIGDLDSQNVRLQVEVTPAGSAAWPLIESTNGARNAVSSVQLSAAQALQPNTVYTYRVRATDLTPSGDPVGYSSWSPPCEVQYDTTALDGVPIVEGIPTLDVDGEVYHLLKFGRANLVTLRPDPADVGEVVRYSYGFAPERVSESSASVAAGRDGSVTVSVVPWEVDGSNDPAYGNTLYVRAYAGNGSVRTAAVEVVFDPEFPMPDPVPHVRDDVDGDGVPDLSGFRDLGNGKGMFYTYPVQPGGALLEPVALMTTESYTDANSDTVRGDFDGDGKTDFAVFKSVSATSTTVSLLRSTGNVPYADALSDIQVKTLSLDLAKMKVLAGDVNADGKDDLVFGYATTATNWNLKVMLASIDSHDDPEDTADDQDPHDDEILFADPVDWLGTGANSVLANTTLLIGNFDKVPGVDVMEFYDLGSCRTRAFMHKNLGGSFEAGQLVWDSNDTSTWCMAKSRFTVGRYSPGQRDVDGVVATYDFGGCQMGLYTFTPKYVYSPPQSINDMWTFEPHTQHFNSTPGLTQYWCAPATAAPLSMVDMTGDGLEDLVFEYGCCGPYQQRVWVWTATGTSGTNSTFQTRTLKWQGALGPAGTGSVRRDAVTRYQLVAKHSGLCLAVTGGSTVEHAPTSQQPCAPALLNTQFTLEERGAAYVRMHPVHDPARCLNVSGGLTTDGRPIIASTCTAGQSNESWEFRYSSGFTSVPGVPQAGDIAIQMLSNLSGKCIGISASSTSAGAAGLQWTCNGNVDQYFYLRPLPAAPTGPVARWSMNAASGTAMSDDSGRGAGATAASGATLGSGVLTLNGTTGFAATTGPVLDTTKSFTVSGWIKPNVVNKYETIIAQEGSQYSAFYLRVNGTTGKWNFALVSNVNVTSGYVYNGVEGAAAQAGAWAHLTGVYDAPTRTATLYVNGVSAGSVVVTAPGASSSGPVVLGAARSGGNRTDHVNGQIDDVTAWARTLSAAEVTALYAAGRA